MVSLLITLIHWNHGEVSGRECNAIYFSFVPQNPARLIEKVGKDEFNNRLDSIFTEARKSIFWWWKSSKCFLWFTEPL